MKFHHIGIAVKNIHTSISHYKNSLGWEIHSEIISDPIQRVKIQFMRDENNILFELIEPFDKTSPIYSLLKKRISLYHFCYEVNDIITKIEELTKNDFLLITGPVEAVALNGKRIAFLINHDNLTIELVEK
jgi:methylmalonyl-CoA/ethylmalonyl-CoA epimerase